ncbi:MAG: hypothetical protein K5665_10935 [Saccharofermentans sp.]|nr:hypothetical protein [Saccharofermentans sp.]
MKRIKAVACVLAVVMLAGIFAGCSKTTKISTTKFVKACEKLKLDYYELGEDEPDEDDAEDGFYTYMDAEMIEDDEDYVEDYFSSIGLDQIIDVDDVESFAFAVKCTGLGDVVDINDPEEIADLELDGAVAIQITLKDDGYAEDIMDFIDEKLDDFGISTKDLSNQEFYSSKKEGFVRFHVDVAKLGEIVLDNDDIMDIIDLVMDSDDFEDLVNELTGDISVSIEVNGSNVFVIFGGSLNTKSTVLGSFANAFGAATNPEKIPMNEDVTNDIVDIAVEKVLGGFGSYNYDDDDWDDYGDYDWDDYDDYDWDDYDEEED